MSINSYLYQTFSLLRIWWRKLKHIKVDFTEGPDTSWFRYNLSNPSNWNNCIVNPLLRLWVPLKVLVTILQARLLSPFRLLLVYFINVVSFQCTFQKCLSPSTSLPKSLVAPFLQVSCTCPISLHVYIPRLKPLLPTSLPAASSPLSLFSGSRWSPCSTLYSVSPERSAQRPTPRPPPHALGCLL